MFGLPKDETYTRTTPKPDNVGSSLGNGTQAQTTRKTRIGLVILIVFRSNY
jgi:hypothetical protein